MEEARRNSIIWSRKMENVERKLQSEIASFDDIVVVDMVDVYRHLPDKLLLYFDR